MSILSMNLIPMSVQRLSFLLGILWCALVHFSDAQAQDTKENAEFKLAVNLYNDGLYELAAEQFKQFIGSYPSTTQGTEARFYLGLAQMRLNRLEDARLTFQTFALTYPDNPKAPEAWWNAGDVYALLKNYREAALAFERVKVFHPKSTLSPEALVQAGKYFRLAGANDDARRVLRIVLQEYGSSSAVHKAHTSLGELYFQEGNFAQAQNELTRVIQGDPSPEARAQALLTLGDIYRAQWRVDQARAQYEEIIAKHGASSAATSAYVHLGGLYLGSAKYSEAAENFSKVVGEKGQKDSVLLLEAAVGLGDAHAGLNDHSKAIRQYEQALKTFLDKQPPIDLLWRIVSANIKAGNHARVAQTCNRILAANPPDDMKRRVLVTMARNAEEGRSPAEAVRLYSLFLESYPNDAYAPLMMMSAATLCKNSLNDLRRALYFCEQMISRFPFSPHVSEAYGIAADCYEQLKDVGRSMELRREFLKQYPSAESGGAMRERLEYLETFEAKDKDAALQELALMLGDIVAGQDNVALAFRLGETYFNDLKNYAAAAAQFTTVVNSGMTGKRFEEALLYRARSYEYLSRREPSYRSQAISSYTTFLNSYAADPRADAAALALYLLRATSLVEAQSAYADILSTCPQTTHQGEMLLRIGILQQESKALVEALETFGSILGRHGSSSAAEEAGYRRIDVFLREGLLDSAIAEGNKYIIRYPKGVHTAHVLARVGEVCLLNNAPEQAIELFSDLLSNFGYTDFAPYVRRRLAAAYVSDDRLDEAISLYKELVEETSKNPFNEGRVEGELVLALAKALRLSGNIADARTLLFQLLAQERSGEVRSEALTMLGMLAKEGGDRELATAYFQQAPDSAATREVADLLFETGAYADAAAKYKLLAKSATTDTEIRYYEAQAILASMRMDDLQGAQRDIAAFSKKHKNADEYLAAFELDKGTYYFRKEEYGSAKAAFDVVTGKYDDTPSVPEAIYWSGKVLEVTGKPKEAKKKFEEILEDYPKSPIVSRARLALGNLAYQSEQWDEASRHFKSVIDDPQTEPSLMPFAMSNLIETYETAGVFDAALDLTRKYLDRYPLAEDNLDKRIKIGILYQRLGYYDQSIVHLQGLIDQAGSDLEGEIRYYIAEANFHKGEFQQAVLDFLKVPYLVTKKGKIDWTANSLYMAGQSYERLGRHEQAVAMYKQIVDRPGIDETFKAAARKEIDRVNLVIKRSE